MATDISGPPESSPGSSGQRRRSGRRSWHQLGKSIKLEFENEPTPRKLRKRNEEEIEVLQLTHFSKPPRIDFGTVRVGKSRVRKLRVRNSEEYDQQVVIEKFPHKKHFAVDQVQFVVEAENEVQLTLTWTPTEGSSCREMILFKVEEAYRLQTIMFGKAEEPPKPKPTRKTWLSKPSRPFSVIQHNANVPPKSRSGPQKLSTAVPQKPQKLSSHTKNIVIKSQPVQAKGSSSPKFLQPSQKFDVLDPRRETYVKHGDENQDLLNPRRSTFSATSPQLPNTPTIDFPGEGRRQRGKCISPVKEKENTPPTLQKDDLPITPLRRATTYTKLNGPTDSKSHRFAPNSTDIIEVEEVEMEVVGSTQIVTSEITETEIVHYEKIVLEVAAQKNQDMDDEENSSSSNIFEDSLCVPNQKSPDVAPLTLGDLENQSAGNAQGTPEILKHFGKVEVSPDIFMSHKVYSETVIREVESFSTETVNYIGYEKYQPMERNTNVFKAPGLPVMLRSGVEEQAMQSTPLPHAGRLSFDSAIKKQKYQPSPVPSPRRASAEPIVLTDRTNRRLSSDTFCKGPAIKGQSWKELFADVLEHEEVNPRRVSTLTVTKSKPEVCNASRLPHNKPRKELFERIPSPDNQRRLSNITVNKEQPDVLHLMKPTIGNITESFDETDNSAKGFQLIGDPFGLLNDPGLNPRRFSTLTVTKPKPTEAKAGSKQYLHNIEHSSHVANDATFSTVKSPPSKIPVYSPDKVTIPSVPVKHLDNHSPSRIPVCASPAKSPANKMSPPKRSLNRSERKAKKHHRRSVTHVIDTSEQVQSVDVVVERPTIIMGTEQNKKDRVTGEDEHTRVRSPEFLPLDNKPEIKSQWTSDDHSDTASIPSTPTKRGRYPLGVNFPMSPVMYIERGDKGSPTWKGTKSPARSPGRFRHPSSPARTDDPEVESLRPIKSARRNLSVRMEISMSSPSDKLEERGQKSEAVERSVEQPVQQECSIQIPSNTTKREGRFTQLKEKPVSKTTRPFTRAAAPVNVTRAPLKTKAAPPTTKLSTQSREKKRVPNVNATKTKNVTQAKEVNSTRSKEVNSTQTKEIITKSTDSSSSGMTRTMMLRRQAALARSGKEASGNNKVPKPRQKPAVTVKPKPQVKGLAQSKLILVKSKSQTALPKHPLPFAAKNMYYDERWMEKQERGFIQWLNFVLTPPDEHVEAVKPQKIDAGKLCVDNQRCDAKLAPSKETLSLRTYTARRRLNRVRRAACKMFQSDEFVKVIHKLEVEITCRRLAIRKDRMIHADLGLKQKILDMILSYNPLWLRIGLETVYGELLPIHGNTDIVGMSRFILTRLLGNPDIAQQYAHPTVPHLYSDGYSEALGQFILKKFLLLVFFLDNAKLARLIDHDPCLFCKDADFKSSRDILLIFSRDNLSGEGDITRHLSFMGYVVHHSQSALEEYDFAVKCLAKDLRDGVRLSRVIEMLTQSWVLARSLRVPAISRLQKVHNIEVTFKALESRGLELTTVKGGKIDPRDVVDGHREKTLQVLWRIIFNFQVEMMLNEEQLKQEVTFLKDNLHLQTQMAAVMDDDLDSLGVPRSRRESMGPDLYFRSERLGLLLRWCRAVCAYYDIKIENFTVSFSDGRALCYIVHHYHPGLLPREAINQNTTQTQEDNNTSINSDESNDSFSPNWTSTFSPGTGKSTMYDNLLANERENFKLLYEKVSELGGVPIMVRSADMSGTIPDEKVVITYVTYLCARLLDIREEARAARVIQAAWRRHRLGRHTAQVQKRHNAVEVLQRAVRIFLERCRWRRMRQNVVKLQAYCRGYLTRKRLYEEKHKALREEAALKIQRYFCCWVKGLHERRRFQQVKRSAVVIQRSYRALVLMRRQREEFQHQRAAAISLQTAWRKRAAHRWYTGVRAAVITIQSYARMYIKQQEYERIRQATLLIQEKYRATILARCTRQQYLAKRHAAILLQAAWKAYKANQESCKQYQAATTLQACFRGHRQHRQFLLMKDSACCIQRWYRSVLTAKVQRKVFLTQRRAVITMQAVWKGHRARQDLNRMKVAAVVIQSQYRRLQTQRKFTQQKHAVCQIQAWFRACVASRQQRRAFMIQKGAVLTIQAAWRGHKVRQEVRAMRAAATLIQTHYRRHTAQKQFTHLKQAARQIQERYRAFVLGSQQRREFMIMKGAVMTIQAVWRGHTVRQEVQRMAAASTLIQANFRRHRAQKKYAGLRQAVYQIQAWYRSCLARRQQQREFMITKGAVITIQAAWRGHKVRQEVQRMAAASTLIQANFRRYRAQKQYSGLRQAVCQIQAWYRSCLARRQQQREFMITKGAVITIQAAWRGHKVRQEVQRSAAASTLIQANFRRYRAQKQYSVLRQAVRQIQAWYRSCLARRQQQREFMITKGAVITIQAAWRGHKVRQEVQRMAAASTLIQANIRRYRAQKQYSVLRQAVRQIQAWYRAIIVGRHRKREYMIMKGAALTIQAAWKGYRIRKEITNMKDAATLLQSHYRRYRQQRKYTRTLQSVRKIQTWCRAIIAGKRQKTRFLLQKSSAITIQSGWRGFKVRSELKKKNEAATIIQSFYKRHKQCKHYRLQRSAASVLQTWYRAVLVGKEQQRKYVMQKSAAVAIQSAWRGHRVRWECKRRNKAASRIQSFYRSYRQAVKYRHQREAACTLQTWYKSILFGRKQRQEFMQQKKAVQVIQAAWKGYRVRCNNRKMNSAATVIQAYYRMHRQYTSYSMLKQAACTLQTQYRALLVGRRQRAKFLVKKYAIISIQSAWRGHVVRNTYKQQKCAATVIQSQFKRHRQQQQYQRQKQAVCRIQAWIRSVYSMKLIQRDFLIYKGAAITIQAVWRGYLIRKQIKKENNAAVIIQCHFRKHKDQRDYRLLRQSVCKIQCWYRALLAGRAQRTNYLQQRLSAVAIQAMWRGHVVRKEVSRMHSAAARIQSQFRGRRQRLQYERMQRAARTITEWYRGVQLTTVIRTYFMVYKGAAITIQAVWRGHVARSRVRHMHSAATNIQSAYRMYLQQKKYQGIRESTCTIQNWYRAILHGRALRCELDNQRKAAVKIQTTWRRFTAQSSYQRLRTATLVLQAAYRGHQVRCTIRKQHAAACVIQRWIRAVQKGQCQRVVYHIQRGAAIAIQAGIRKWLARSQYQKKRSAAIALQASYRGLMARRECKQKMAAIRVLQKHMKATIIARRQKESFSQLRKAAIQIQSIYRGLQARRHVHYLKCVITLQAHVRRHLVQKRYMETKHCCVRVQAFVRMHQARSRYIALRQAAVVIQSHFRAYRMKQMSQEAYQHTKAATVVIQAHVRGFLCRRTIKRQNLAAAIIQAQVRTFQARSRFLALRRATLVIQKHYRARVIGQLQMKEFMIQKGAAITIQAWVRGALWRKELHRCQRAAIKIQSHVRTMLCQHKYERLRAAALVVQQHYRARLAMKAALKIYGTMYRAVVTIQAAFRGYCARRLARKVRAARCIQAVWRMHRCRRDYLQTRASIVKVQSMIRAHQVRCRYLKTLRAVRVIQQRWRATLEMQKVTLEYHVMIGAAISMQAVVRGHLARRRYRTMLQGICRLQAHVRRRQAQKEVSKRLKALVVLQTRVRAYLDGRKVRIDFLKKKSATTQLQAAVRGFLARQHVRRHFAAVKIQALYRGYKQRLHYQQKQHHVVILQSHVRRWLVQRQTTKLRQETRAAIVIQTCIRKFISRRRQQEKCQRRQVYVERMSKVVRRHLQVITIQRAWRNVLAMRRAKKQVQSVIMIQRWVRVKLERVRYLHLQHNIIKLQRACRAYLQRRCQAAAVIQIALRKWLAKRRKDRMHQAATKMQALWRGFKIRKAVKSKKVLEARRKIEEANAAATEEKQLGNRTASALDFLLKYKQLAYILEAVMHLDVATRLSPVCCERMVEGNAVGVLFRLIQSCNRSLPHMEIIKYVVNILLNLAKYERTAGAVFEVEESVETLVELLQIYREKGLIFTKTSMLLGILAYDPHRRKAILATAKVAEKMRSIHTLTLRKHKMNEKRQITRTKMAASKSFCGGGVVMATPGKQARIGPEWVLRRDSIREMQDPMAAINFLLNCLQITPR